MSKDIGTTGTIEALLKTATPEILLMLAPNGSLCIQAKQFVVTGPEGNRSNVVHQVEAPTLIGCLEDLKKRINTCESMQTRIVQPPRRN